MTYAIIAAAITISIFLLWGVERLTRRKELPLEEEEPPPRKDKPWEQGSTESKGWVGGVDFDYPTNNVAVSMLENLPETSPDGAQARQTIRAMSQVGVSAKDATEALGRMAKAMGRVGLLVGHSSEGGVSRPVPNNPTSEKSDRAKFKAEWERRVKESLTPEIAHKLCFPDLYYQTMLGDPICLEEPKVFWYKGVKLNPDRVWELAEQYERNLR